MEIRKIEFFLSRLKWSNDDVCIVKQQETILRLQNLQLQRQRLDLQVQLMSEPSLK
jgi:hypothetical protein